MALSSDCRSLTARDGRLGEETHQETERGNTTRGFVCLAIGCLIRQLNRIFYTVALSLQKHKRAVSLLPIEPSQ
jgi:hypothetical protein